MTIGIVVGFLTGVIVMFGLDRLREQINVRSFITGIKNNEVSITQSAEYCLDHILPKLGRDELVDLPYEVLQVAYNIWEGQISQSEKLSTEEYDKLKTMGVHLLSAIRMKRSPIASNWPIEEADA